MVPAGARISAGKSGSVTRSLPISAVAAANAIAGELHAVARIAGEADDDALLLYDFSSNSPRLHALGDCTAAGHGRTVRRVGLGGRQPSSAVSTIRSCSERWAAG